jgi:deoxyadenosine/deoxycytidine kinase
MLKREHVMYLVEGNMGVGKSTLLRILQKKLPNVSIHFEPKENWMNNDSGQSLLGSFFKDPHRWEYTVETFIMMCRAKEYLHTLQKNNPNLIMERSIYTGHFCYAQHSREKGYFTKLEWHLYNEWADFLLRKNCPPQLGFIYLQSQPETCFQRVKKRNWDSEKDAPYSFIENIHKFHEKFLIQKNGIFPELKNIPVLILDCNIEFENDNKIINNYVEKIEMFMQQTQIIPKATKSFLHTN